LKGVLASYRWRRRLLWLGAVAVTSGAITAVALTWTNTAPPEAQVSNIPVKISNSEPKPIHLTRKQEGLALGVAARFIHTAVARKNIDSSWGLVSRQYRQGFTRKQWDTGNIPAPPYPEGNARWALDYSDEKGVGFQIALFPPKGSTYKPQVFLIYLHRIGPSNKRWVVDQWEPAPFSRPQSPSSGSGSAIESVLPQNPGAAPGKSRESRIWLLIPVGILSLVLVIPVVVLTTNWYRGRRARLDFLRS
jgi:hypothetical protein